MWRGPRNLKISLGAPADRKLGCVRPFHGHPNPGPAPAIAAAVANPNLGRVCVECYGELTGVRRLLEKIGPRIGSGHCVNETNERELSGCFVRRNIQPNARASLTTKVLTSLPRIKILRSC